MSFAYHLMGGGYRLGRFLGIDVRLNQTWFITAGIMLLMFAFQSGAGLAALPLAIAFVVALFASVLAHEYGHALAARSYGIPTRAITLHGLGGLAQIEAEPRRPSHEIVVASAGPAVSFMLAGAGFAATVLLSLVAAPLAELAIWFAWVNLLLGAFNLLPGMPLDGGRILRGILWARSGDRRAATLTAAAWGVRVGQGLMIFGVLGILGVTSFGGLPMLLVGLFVSQAAGAEKRRMEAQAAGTVGLDDLFGAWRRMASSARRPHPGPRHDGGDVEEVVRFPDGREVLIRKPKR